MFMRHSKHKKLLLAIFGALLLVGIALLVLVLGNKYQTVPTTHTIPGPTDSLALAVNDYLDEYDCQPYENSYWKEYVYDFVPNYGEEEYLVYLMSSCHGPLGGAGGNGPILVISHIDSEYKIIGRANGEGVLIEDTDSDNEVPNIFILGDDAPPGNYQASELVWDSKTQTYIDNERTITESRKKELLNRYLESTLTQDSVMQYSREALSALPDVTHFSTSVHPTKGLEMCGRTWTPEQIVEQVEKQEVIFCGYAEGSGEPIHITLEDRLRQYARLNYMEAPRFAFNKPIGVGGFVQQSLKQEKRPYMMYHFPYTSTYTDEEGNEVPNDMSYESLAVIFDKADDGEWYVVGLVPDYWTP